MKHFIVFFDWTADEASWCATDLAAIEREEEKENKNGDMTSVDMTN